MCGDRRVHHHFRVNRDCDACALPRPADAAFTLIEILIVIVVLGLLAAIVVFAVGGTRDDTVSSLCRTDVRAIQTAAESVFTSTGSYPGNEAGLLASAHTSSSLKEWPGGAVTHHGHVFATTDDVAFTFNGSGASYQLGIYGKNLAGTVVGETATANDVRVACTT